MRRRAHHWAAAASLSTALVLAGCGTSDLESGTAAGFQASVRDIATAAAGGDQAGATLLATELSQAVTVAQGQGTVTADRAAEIQSTIDELLAALAAELGQPAPAAPEPGPTVETPEESSAPEPPADAPAEAPEPSEQATSPGPVSTPEEPADDEETDEQTEKELRDAEREQEKLQREQEKAEKAAEHEQEKGGNAKDG
ncbi:hypothetical protein [Arthrobacter sp. TMN-50]